MTNEVLDETVLIENQVTIYDHKLEGSNHGFASIFKKNNEKSIPQFSNRSNGQYQLQMIA